MSTPTVESTSAQAVPAEFAPHLPPALVDLNVPAYVVDREGRVCWLNRAAAELVGNAVGLPFTSVVALDKREARRIFEQNLAGAGERDISVKLVSSDGSLERVDISSVPLGPNHHAVGMFGLAIPSDRHAPPAACDESPLTPRQHEVLRLLADGASTAAIADRLFLSQQTVRNHVRQILQRLDARSRLAAVATARRTGLV